MDLSQNSSRKSCIMEALQNTIEENSIMFDDIESFIGKAVYADQFPAPEPNTTQRIQLLQGWQSTRQHLIENQIFGMIQNIETMEKKLHQCPTTPDHSYKMDPSCATKEAPVSMPQYIRAMLNLTDGNMITLGPNGTQIPKKVFVNMNWSFSNANITRKILMEVFDRQILATHTLSGKPSPAFMDCNKPTKMQLNPEKIQDIIYIMTNSLDMSEKEVRQAITTKCADENKMFRQREQRRLGIAKRKIQQKNKI